MPQNTFFVVWSSSLFSFLSVAIFFMNFANVSLFFEPPVIYAISCFFFLFERT